MIGRPQPDEAAPYYFGYINRISGEDILNVLARQLEETLPLLRGVSEERSLYRYAPGKWSLREMLGHVNDTERVFQYRALWFARGLTEPLPDFDQNICVAAAHSDDFPWAGHVEEFRTVRLSTLTLFRKFSSDAWLRAGTASGNRFTVRAMAYIIAGHLSHHMAILQEKYLSLI